MRELKYRSKKYQDAEGEASGEDTFQFPMIGEVRHGVEQEHERIARTDGLRAESMRKHSRPPGVAITAGSIFCWFLSRPMAERDRILREGRAILEARLKLPSAVNFLLGADLDPSAPKPSSGAAHGAPIAGIVLEDDGRPKKGRAKKELVGDDRSVGQASDRPRPGR